MRVHRRVSGREGDVAYPHAGVLENDLGRGLALRARLRRGFERICADTRADESPGSENRSKRQARGEPCKIFFHGSILQWRSDLVSCSKGADILFFARLSYFRDRGRGCNRSRPRDLLSNLMRVRFGCRSGDLTRKLTSVADALAMSWVADGMLLSKLWYSLKLPPDSRSKGAVAKW